MTYHKFQKPNSKSFSDFTYSILVWTIACSLLGFFRFYGIQESDQIEIKNPQLLRFPMLLFMGVGIISGIFYELIERRLRKKRFLQVRPYWVTLAVKTFAYAILVQLIVLLVSSIFSYLQSGELHLETISNIARGKIYWVFFCFFLLTSFGISFFKIFIQHFGGKTLFNLIIGKYYRPFEEYRIFMFLDMRDSTTIAEQLGTIQYSRFIQECFRDFTEIIERFQPEVYQYVGDEIVLTWNPDKGINDFNCLQAGFAFNQILQNRKEAYLEQYGVVPFFKAGAHIGRVRVTEVGVIRRAIAYHGDVMNTTARIQSQCNALGFEVLISEELRKELPRQSAAFSFQEIAHVELKGKESAVNLYGVKMK